MIKKSFDDIYKYLQDILLPALRERAIKDNWPGVYGNSFKTYKYDDSRFGIELSFINRNGFYEQNFKIEWSNNKTVDDSNCQEEVCFGCQFKNTDKCPDCEGIDFRYNIFNIVIGKNFYEKLDKAISEHFNILERLLEKKDKFSECHFITYQVAYGSYECYGYIPHFNVLKSDILLDLIEYCLVIYTFKLPNEIIREREKGRAEMICLLSEHNENKKETRLRSRFLKEFVNEEFFSDKKEKRLSLEERRELFDKMKKENPYFAKITNKLNLEIKYE